MVRYEKRDTPTYLLKVSIFLISFALAILLAGCQRDNRLQPSSTKNSYNLKQESMVKTKVSRVVDGDTIVISSGEKVRLIGVDTPESVKPNSAVEYYGEEASNFTKTVLTGHTIYLEKDVSDTDKYNRLLRYVYLDDGTLFNLLLVEQGYANVLTYPPDIKYAEIFRQAEREARDNNRGLWQQEGNEVK